MGYEEWSNTAKSIRTLEVNRSTVRDCYVFPNGIHCQEDYVMPWNPFRKSFSVVMVDHEVPRGTVIPGARISEDYYTPEGIGVPEFIGGNPMKAAFEYAMNLKQGVTA